MPEPLLPPTPAQQAPAHQDSAHQTSTHQKLSHPVGVLHEIRWQEICPWLILVRALRVTLLTRVLLLTVVGLLLTQWGWGEIDRLCSLDVASAQEFGDESLLLTKAVESQSSDRGAMQWQRFALAFVHGWYGLTEPFHRLADRGLSLRRSLRFGLDGLWGIATWALFGGAIARIAAMYLTRGETLGPLVALRAAISVWPSTVGSPIIGLLFAAAMAVPLLLLGLSWHFNFMAVAAGFLWIFVLALGFLLAVVLLGLGFGWPLMWACLAVERSDAFDGVSRCYAYVYQKPLQLAFYVVVASLLGSLGGLVVALFTATSITLTEWGLSWGAGGAGADQILTTDWNNSVAPLATRAINGWTWACQLALHGYPLACLWPMSVGIYLLLRRDVDATEMEEITLSDGTPQPGLPGLHARESGVPEMKKPAGNNDE